MNDKFSTRTYFMTLEDMEYIALVAWTTLRILLWCFLETTPIHLYEGNKMLKDFQFLSERPLEMSNNSCTKHYVHCTLMYTQKYTKIATF